MKYLYLLIDLGAISVPFIFSFHPRLQFYKQWKYAIPAILLPMILFLPWDALFTARGIWGFNDRYISGTKFFGLPIEEILFFICIPYACLFTYYCFTLFGKKSNYSNRKPVWYALSAIYIIVGLVFFRQAYTASTFILLGLFQLVCIHTMKASLKGFYSIYAVLLIPFFIVNGLLTGTGIDEQVVWYNDAENFGIRLLTIPVEDVFYGLLMILMSVYFFEYLRRRKV